jgi:hypothetical protein
MPINIFPPAASAWAHCASVGATFLVLVGVAVAIDWLIRRCERGGTSPALVRLLHLIAQGLVLLDGMAIVVETGLEVAARIGLAV